MQLTDEALDLEDFSVFLGEASPLYPKEVPSQTGFFWREDGDMHLLPVSFSNYTGSTGPVGIKILRSGRRMSRTKIRIVCGNWQSYVTRCRHGRLT